MPPWTLNVTPSEGFQRITKLLLCFLVNVKIPNVVQFFEFGVGAKKPQNEGMSQAITGV